MLFNAHMKSIDDIRRENLQALERRFGSLKALSDALERSESQVSQWKNGAANSGTGKPRGMRTDTARYIEEKTLVAAGWLDQDHSLVATSEAVSVPALTPTPQPGQPAVYIPLLANAGSMGPGTDVEHDDIFLGHLPVSPDWIDKRLRPTSHDALRFIHAYGDSMSPTFCDGDVLLVDTGRRDPSDADGVYVLATSKRIFIKRVTERFDGGHQVTSDNKNVTLVQELNGSHEINVLGRVIWVWNGKKI